jgi:aryl-alcohol dehydrogenase-like predicted oxidoreductase
MLEQSIDRSLKRLKTDHVDLVQLHSCGRDMLEQGDVIAVLQRARDAGKTRYIGYSGDRDAAVYAIECGAFDSLQTSISIADQEPLTLTVPKALERKMGVIAKRPIANAVWKNAENPGGYPEEYWKRLQALDYAFLKKSMDEAVSVALRFTLGAPGVHTAIVGTKNPQRWVANARLLQEGPLPQEQIEEIRARWSEVAAGDWAGQG